MNREDTLELYKNYTKDLQKCSNKGKDVMVALKALNSCDALWVMQEFNTWLKSAFPEEVIASGVLEQKLQ